MAQEDVRRAHGYHALGVKRVVDETDDARSYVLDVPADLADAFRYRAGQFCTFRVHLDGDELLRSYSMSSAPEVDDDLTVTVKRVAGGRVSNWFNDHVAEGDVLELTRPAGVFCVRDNDRPVLAFCGGSGVTPIISVAKSLLTTTQRPVRLLYANRDRGSVIFDAELDRLQREHPGRLEVRHHFDSDGGFLEPAMVEAFASGSIDSDIYICGPGPFMDLVERTLLGVGVHVDQILIERFVNDGLPADLSAPADAAGGEGADADADVPSQVTVILKGQSTEIVYQPGDTLLQTARRGGLQPPFSCEAGNCATCMGLLQEGTATMRTNNALTPEEVEEGWVLTCQAVPHGATVTVEYESF
ncbi:MAG: ferredoxin--NADP reductase [Acidimicrobiia bacterium]|nr:ferredoxin--NADP reductase [Acidimicrobiia bacterium]